jgi:DNA-binding beta-propeller fold protein YncE
MPIINNGSQLDRIKKLQARTIYSAYLIEKQAVEDKVLVKLPLSGLKSSELTKFSEAPLFFTAEELNAIVANNKSVQVQIQYAMIITLLSGSGISGFLNGPGSTARFNSPGGTALDSSGNMYIADTGNNVIRMIDTDRNVTTFAGTPQISGFTDGPKLNSYFSGPSALAIDSSGNIYVADSGNNAIRKISGGQVTTIAGSGTAGFSDTGSGQFNNPMGIVIDAEGNIYVADTGNNRIRKISFDASGNKIITTIAGGPAAGSTDGSGTSSRFNGPQGLALDSNGNLYVADTGNNTIRTINLTSGDVTTLAGSAGTSGSDDGTGSAATFNRPTGLAVDANGNVYVTDTGNHTIRKITTPGGSVTTFAGDPDVSTPSDGSLDTAGFSAPGGITIDASGNIYIIDAGSNLINRIETYVVGGSTPVSIPDAPINLQVAAGDTSFLLSWNPPTSTGGLSITGYSISWTLVA